MGIGKHQGGALRVVLECDLGVLKLFLEGQRELAEQIP